VDYLLILGLFLIFLGVSADQLSTVYGLKRRHETSGNIEDALKIEKNPIAREQYRQKGFCISDHFWIELVAGLVIGLLLYFLWGGYWWTFFLAAVFFGVTINNILYVRLNLLEEKFWPAQRTLIPILLVLFLILYFILTFITNSGGRVSTISMSFLIGLPLGPFLIGLGFEYGVGKLTSKLDRYFGALKK
jgi:hypothetical protein